MGVTGHTVKVNTSRVATLPVAALWAVILIPATSGFARAAQVAPLETYGRLPNLENVALSPDGSVLASGGADKAAKLWDVTGDKPTLLQKLEGHEGHVNAVAFSPDGKWIACAVGDRVNAGQAIAGVGESEEAHSGYLYFEIRQDNKPEDPQKWLR